MNSVTLTPALQRKQDRQERDAQRGRLGRGRYDALVKELAALIRLAFEAGATASLFGLEGPLRHGLRSDLCLQGWSWAAADLLARDILADAFRAVRAVRPSYNEGQQEWVIAAGTLIERTLCARCHGPLPDGRPKFCSDLCKNGHHTKISSIRRANEDKAVRIATYWT